MRRLFFLPRSTIARLVAMLVVAQFAATAGILYFVRLSTQETLLSEQKAVVAELRDGLLAEYRKEGKPALVAAIRDRLQFPQSGIPVILLLNADGSVAAGNLDNWPPVIGETTEWTTLTLYRKDATAPEAMAFSASTLSDGSHLLTGHVIENGLQLQKINDEALLAATLLAFPISLLIALQVGRSIARRIASIARTAEAIGAGDLSHRVPLNGTHDAFDQMGSGINEMLERIELLVEELRMVTDSLAHDLRSPVTRLKSHIEQAFADTRDADDLAVLEKISAEADTLLRMLTTALQISRAEAGIGRERFETVALGDLLQDLAEIYGPLAEDCGFSLEATFAAPIAISLHRDLISQALGNLIENACKYARGGTSIRLEARRDENAVVLVVADDGVGIPAELREVALRRFGRLDPARHKPGAGLGLALVASTARLHGGIFNLEDNRPGLRAVIRLPGQDGERETVPPANMTKM
ncbi:HAMP domain-containing sensor histidine kinase [Novosphingobium sp. PP1Y]|uniref:sensor histidine kinase n=1 Tax=Novosphingobium sp. PP1Y TaxID=702113 RepID=UPI00020EF7B3|nr:HAMP domain-containing sensor histidine kinase [Novosphingobium sp. PP1Y]CCA90156.1 integral membrane sensor signal transduction histidine kinase [Novosphingobium sp. PP1Y]